MELFEPLLWSIRLVTACPIHLTPLTEVCPACKKTASPFAGAPFPGICGLCGEKLWLSEKQSNGSHIEDRYAIWCASEMLLVIGTLSEFEAPLPIMSLANLLYKKVTSLQKSNLEQKLAAAGCSKRSSYLWGRGVVMPRVETLFRLCFHLDLRPVDLLREAAGLPSLPECAGAVCGRQPKTTPLDIITMLAEPTSFTLSTLSGQTMLNTSQGVFEVRPHYSQSTDRAESLPQPVSTQLPKAPLRSRFTYEPTARRNQIRSQLECALVSEPPPSLNAVARSLRMSSSTQLRKIEPDLSHQLIAVGQIWKEKQGAVIRDALEKALNSESLDSLEMFCRSCGISYWVVRREYPDLKASYAARFRRLRDEARKERSAQRQSVVDSAVHEIRQRGEYPSVGRVKSTTPELKAAGWDEIQAAIRAADFGPRSEAAIGTGK